MDAFNLSNYEDVTNLDDLQRQQAQMENELNAEGIRPEVNELDDTEIHLMEHTKYIYSAAYRELKMDRPDLAEMLMDHVREHKDAQQRTAAQQISAQNANIEEAARQKLELEAMINGGM